MSKPRQTIYQKCNACFYDNLVNLYQKVKALQPVIAKMKCEQCGCQFLLKIERTQEHGTSRVLVTPTLVEMTEVGKRFVRSQEKLKAASAKTIERLENEPEVQRKMIEAFDKMKKIGMPPGLTRDDVYGEIPTPVTP